METLRFPDFYIVGAAKSGTTAIWNHLQKHPQIYVTTDINHKELGYFSHLYGISDRDYYLQFFKDARPEQKIGEVCHAYLSSPESAKAIIDTVPDAKIIIILRNPIYRAYSLYNWMVMNGYEYANTFEAALKYESSRSKSKSFLKNNPQGYYQNYMYFSSGLYYEQVKKYFDLYKHENIKVMIYEEFIKNQQIFIREIEQFLGIDHINLQVERVNVSASVKLPIIQYIASYLLPKFFGAPLKLGALAKKTSDFLLYRNKSLNAPPKILDATYRRLAQQYSEDIHHLSKLLNINLTALWLK